MRINSKMVIIFVFISLFVNNIYGINNVLIINNEYSIQDTVIDVKEQEILNALSSPKDEYGIPANLYFIDDSLLILKADFNSKKNASINRLSNEKKRSLYIIAISSMLVLIEISDDSDTWYYGGIPLAPLGGLFAALGAFSFISDSRKQSQVNVAIPEELINYYNRNYSLYLNN